MLNSPFFAPLAWLYGTIVDLRNLLFDQGILKSKEYDIPIVCVGNLTVGGTGKTPVTEFLIEQFSDRYQVAVLSRGYMRKTRGFVLATAESSFRAIGDEPKQIKLKYPDIPVAVCEKRCEGIRRLREVHPDINLIIMDDAFQHRQVEPWVTVVLMDYNNPIYTDQLLPWGRLRDRCNQLTRANFVVTTKCPASMSPLDMRLVNKNLELYPYQSLYFSMMEPAAPLLLFPDAVALPLLPKGNVVALSGIANPTAFVTDLECNYTVQGVLSFRDHHIYRMSDMEALVEMLKSAPEDTVVVTTEKDAVKLTNRKKIPLYIQQRLYYRPIRFTMTPGAQREFLRQLELYVRENQKYSLLHPE